MATEKENCAMPTSKHRRRGQVRARVPGNLSDPLLREFPTPASAIEALPTLTGPKRAAVVERLRRTLIRMKQEERRRAAEVAP
jgi:hypothetical protein